MVDAPAVDASLAAPGGQHRLGLGRGLRAAGALGLGEPVGVEEIAAHEQKKQNQRKQQLQAEIDEQLRQSATARPATPLGAKLLKADLEPFNERDERDNEARCVLVETIANCAMLRVKLRNCAT